MARYVNYPVFIKYVVQKYLRKTHSAEDARRIWERTERIYKNFVDEAPDIGFSENDMSKNLYMALAVFAFHEATERKLTREELREIMRSALPEQIPVVSRVADMNKPAVQTLLHWYFVKYKLLSDRKLKQGKWGNSWRVEMNPHGRKKGVAFDVVGCPLVDFARSHGYMDIMPVLCEFDHITARLMHARLIRKHTIAEGGESCDYWYIGDKEDVGEI